MSCDHIWNRTNGATTEDGADTFWCEKCGATGKSYGLGGFITEDRTTDIDPDRKRDYKQEYWDRKKRQLLKSLGRGNGLEWSKEQYERRIQEAQNDDSNE